MSVEDDILENARRLRDDAWLLFNAKRYASCGLLQVICLEELGKAYLMGQNIPRDKNRYHHQKQEAAISLSAAVKMHHLLEKTCEERGWDYWGSSADAENYYEWLKSEDGRRTWEEATQKARLWLRITRHGVLEKLRLVAAYIDDGPHATGRQIEEGMLNTYKAFDEKWAREAFEFIDVGFECFEDERVIGHVELYGTTLWKTTVQ